MRRGAWTIAGIPDQTGRRALITGANSGIGYHTALELARKGAHVLLASRDVGRGEAALAKLRQEAPGASAELVVLDLATLDGVRAFAAKQVESDKPLDLLINNAGVMAPRQRLETVDGFELQFGTNVLGHFALTALLLPLLEKAPAARVVMVASIAHRRGRLQFDDLQATKRYSPMETYAQSKLADLMLTFELDRRLRAVDSTVRSVAAHPGVANTNLFQSGSYGAIEKAARRFAGVLIGLLLNSDADGAVPTLYAATAAEAGGGGYFGPLRGREIRGTDVGVAKVELQARDQAAQRRLWEVCEELAGVKFL